MQRRDFISLLGGATAWPIAAQGQQAMPVIGYLSSGASASTLAGISQGLNEMGLVEGRNFAVEPRATEQYDRLPALVDDLVRHQIVVIVALGSANAALAAKAATTTIPIVFGNGADPVELGIVASLNQPGGNITGISYFSGTLDAKRLELLRELVPQVQKVGFIMNPNNARAEIDRREVQAAARSVGQQIIIADATSASEIDAAFAMLAQQLAGAILVNGDGFFQSRRAQFAVLAARHRIPASYNTREYVLAGGLMSYGDDRAESYRQIGRYVGRILNGEKPANLPVLQPTKFKFAINLSTARALGIEFPASFHLRADEVIE
jgi:putative ABC transport system substrate-binding protein